MWKLGTGSSQKHVFGGIACALIEDLASRNHMSIFETLAEIKQRHDKPQKNAIYYLALVVLPKRTLGADDRPLNHHLNPPRSP